MTGDRHAWLYLERGNLCRTLTIDVPELLEGCEPPPALTLTYEGVPVVLDRQADVIIPAEPTL